MAPKLQSKTLETKAQTCPLNEAQSPQKAAAESSGHAVAAGVAGSGSRAASAASGLRTTKGAPPPLTRRPAHSSPKRGARSVGLAVILRTFELHFKPLHADLKAVHGLDGSLSRDRIVVTYKTCVSKRKPSEGREEARTASVLLMQQDSYMS